MVIILYNRSKLFILLAQDRIHIKNAIALNLVLDNDPADRTATYKINNKFREVKDWAPVISPDHKDFNEFLMK